jgi:lysophospholipase L1-like esterase
MKKIISTFGVVLIGLLTGFYFTGCNNELTNTSHEIPDNGTSDDGIPYDMRPVVCFGNSLTAGESATTVGQADKTKSYPAFLQNKIKVPVINAGISGDTTAWALGRIESDVLSKDPQAVIIELGANDISGLTSVETTTENLQSIINCINDGTIKIYLVKFYTNAVAKAMLTKNGIPSFMHTSLINQYDNMFNTLVQQNNVELIEDIWTGIWGTGGNMSADGFHPNAAGYEIMAGIYYNAMAPYLQEKTLTALGLSPRRILLTPDAQVVPSFTVPAESGVNYQWYDNSAPDPIGRRKIPGATGVAYTPPKTMLGTTYYQVVVTDAAGTQTESEFVEATVFPAANLLWDDIQTPPNVSGNNVVISTESGAASIGQYQTIVTSTMNSTNLYQFFLTFSGTKDFSATVAPDAQGKATQGTLHMSIWTDNFSAGDENIGVELHKGQAYSTSFLGIIYQDWLKEKEWVDIEIPCSSFTGSGDWADTGFFYIWAQNRPAGGVIKIKDFFIY